MGPALPTDNYISRFSLDNSGPGGTRLAGDQGAKQEQGA